MLADAVLAKEGAPNEVFRGIILDKQRVSRQMPREVENAKVLVVDDALEPPQIEDDALATESGFARHMALQEEFRANIEKIVALGVRFVAVAKGDRPRRRGAAHRRGRVRGAQAVLERHREAGGAHRRAHDQALGSAQGRG